MVFTATAAILLDGEAFNRLVAEEDLKVWEQNGYIYTKKRGKSGIELYRTYRDTPRRFWAYTCRFTEANAGGGNNTVKFTPQANSAMRIISLRMQMCDSAAGRASTIGSYDEDGVQASYMAAASPDNQGLYLPSIGSVATTVNNTIQSKDFVVVGDGSYLQVYAAALAQNEYFDVVLSCELFGTSTAPTVTHTSSGTASTGTASQNEVTEVQMV